MGVIVVSGTVIADVILSYTAHNQAGGNVSGPFQFQNGANYPVANSVVTFTNAYASGTSGPTVTTTLHGVASVPESVIDGTEFVTTTMAIPAGHSGTMTLTASGGPGSTPGIACAYAFISNAPQSSPLTGVAATGSLSSCGAFLPTLGAVSTTVCGPSPPATAGMAQVNLTAGTISGAIGTCIIQPTLLAGDIVLYISYAITTDSTFAPAIPLPLASFSIQVTIA